MSELAYGEVPLFPAPAVTPSASAEGLVYRARGAAVAVHICIHRDGAGPTISGHVRPLNGSSAEAAGVGVDLLDHRGVPRSTRTGGDGSFRFSGLAPGTYHARFSDGSWTLGVLGITV